MKNNNFQQPQNIPNYSLNKNPYRIQNFNYMFYLLPENPQLYNLQNFASSLLPLGYIPTYPPTQIPNIQNIQNTLPFFFNFGLNNIFQLGMINSNQNLSQNQNLLQNISNINDYQNLNNFSNNSLLNKKTSNLDHQEIENENESQNKIKKIDNNECQKNYAIEEANNISPLKLVNPDLKVEENSEEKNLENIEEKDINKEDNNISEENNEEKSEKNEITTTILENKEDEVKSENRETSKKKKKRRNNYKELLYDTILEHIGKDKKNKNDKNIQLEEEISSNNEDNKKKEEKQKNKNTSNSNTQRNKPKTRAKGGKHSRKKQHIKTLKNNKDILADLEENKNNERDDSKYTKVIFHGKDYKNTQNPIDFMKYNFDFIIDEQYKTTDYTQQHANIDNIIGNANIYENFNYSEQHLDDIKVKWSREKFLGDNKELKNAINKIKDSFNERKIYTNEEKYLDIIKNNNYNVDGLANQKN